MTTNNRRNNRALALVAIAVILAGVLAPAMLNQNAFADVTYTIADQTGAQTGQALYNGGKIAMVEYITDDSRLTLQEVDCMTVSLRKGGSPTGTAYIGFFDSSLNVVYQFGTKDVSTLTTSYTEYTFCNQSDSGYLIPHDSEARFGVKYNGGDSSNSIDVRRSKIATGGTDFEGTGSFKQYYTTSWHSNTDEDLLFKLTNTGTDNYDVCDQLPQSPYEARWLNSHIAGWQIASGVGRCLSDYTEYSGGDIFVAATLTGNDLEVFTYQTYGDETNTPMYGSRLRVQEGPNTLASGETSTDGVWNTQINDFSAGQHTVRVTGGFVIFAECGESSVTCDDSALDDYLDLTFTVS